MKEMGSVKAKYYINCACIFLCMLDVCKSYNNGKVLSRQRRYLTFPKGSSIQMVFDGASPIVDYTYYAVIGLTAAVSWELPHNPFYYDDDLSNSYLNGSLPLLNRNDEDVKKNQFYDRVPDSYYFDGKNNLLQNGTELNEFEYYINKSKTYQWNQLMNNSDPDLIITNNFPFIKKKKIVQLPLGKRSVREPVENELFLKYHRRSRYDLYRLVKKYLDSNGLDGNHCVQRILCDVGKKRKEPKIGTFVEEILKAIFQLPETHSSLINHHTRDYHMAHKSSQNCTEQYHRCKINIWDTSLVF